MRRLRFIPALLLILSACSKNVIEQTPADSDTMGSVSVSLSTDMRNEVVASKADADEPVLDDFRIAIYKTSNLMRLYNDSYANTVGKEIRLNAGEYRLVAQHGDSLGCGFNKPYYMADPVFKVEGRNTNVSAVAKLANVRIAVEYDETISEAYPDYYTVVRHKSYEKKTLKFVKGESRYGYMPGGELILDIYALVDGVWKSYQTAPAEYKPNDFVTFTITSDASEGNLVINIKVDGYTEDKNETVEIPAITVPQAAPSITLAGFDATGNVHEMVEGVTDGANAMASFVARGSIKNCILTVESEYMAQKGVPSEIDFTALSSDTRAVLNAAGFVWDPNMKTSRSLSYIDFSGVISKMLSNVKSDKEDVVMARFGLKVEDSVGKTATSDFSIVSASVKPTLVIEDYNVWATKVVSPVATINKGNANLVDLQVSSDQKTWNDLAETPSRNGYELTYGTIAAEPGTTYYVRTIYNGNENCVSPVLTIRTEDAAQLGNNNFEEWTERQYSYDQTAFDKNNNLPWYQPWTSDQWWDTNATTSMNNDITAAYTFFKTFPLVQYSVDTRSGSGRSAQLTVINIGGANSMAGTYGSWYVGELFLGRGNDADSGDWSKVSEGHAFPSRPSSLTFWYEYVPYSSDDSFGVEIRVKAADGTVLATQTYQGKAASNWTQATVNLPYSVNNKKAASIQINFKASTSGSHSCKMGGEYLEVAGSKPEGDAARIKLSATLRVDDVQLVY